MPKAKDTLTQNDIQIYNSAKKTTIVKENVCYALAQWPIFYVKTNILQHPHPYTFNFRPEPKHIYN